MKALNHQYALQIVPAAGLERKRSITRCKCICLGSPPHQVVRVLVSKKKKKKKKTAADNQADFDEEIINTVNRNVYLDDCLKSVPSIGDAIHLSQQLRDLLSRGGFRLAPHHISRSLSGDSLDCSRTLARRSVTETPKQSSPHNYKADFSRRAMLANAAQQVENANEYHDVKSLSCGST